jgi:hypothetical protein
MRNIKQIMGGLVAIVIGVAIAVPAIAGGKEQKVKLEDCPAAVQKTIKDNANGDKIVEIEKEVTKDGTVLYEAEVKTGNGKEREIVVGADGTLVKIEEEDDDDEDEDEDD